MFRMKFKTHRITFPTDKTENFKLFLTVENEEKEDKPKSLLNGI